MFKLRKHLRHVAAIALLLWLFAAGAAMAHVCASHIDLNTDDCCVTLQEAGLRADALSEPSLASPSAQPWLAPSGFESAVAPPSPQPGHFREAPLWNDSGQRIHMVLLRLAL